MKKDLVELLMIRDSLLMVQGRLVYQKGNAHSLLDGTSVDISEIGNMVIRVTKECESHPDYSEFMQKARSNINRIYR